MRCLKYFVALGISILFFIFLTCCDAGNSLKDYAGTPFSDEVYKKGVQAIPGKIQCEYYDFGGEGIAYHESDSSNSGSGKYNPADGSYLNEFRMNESVDISYTKSGDIDNNSYNMVDPEMNQLYIGWTSPDEWTKYTVDIKSSGRYRIGIMYTAHDKGKISISINDKDITGPLEIPSTFVLEDTLGWRQWHHWNYLDNIAEVDLEKGMQTLSLFTVATGQMNYDYLEFSIIK